MQGSQVLSLVMELDPHATTKTWCSQINIYIYFKVMEFYSESTIQRKQNLRVSGKGVISKVSFHTLSYHLDFRERD